MNSRLIFVVAYHVVLIAISIFGYHEADCHVALSAEKRLIKQLMDNYTVNGLFGRPVRFFNKSVRIGYSISLIQIMNVDAKEQVLTTNVWCRYNWRDETLEWNPLDHENTTLVRIPIANIWKPDFVLYNYADERLREQRPVMAVLTQDGEVTYIPPVIFKSSCAIDTTNFPFDEQFCHLKFGSWTYHGQALDPYFIDNKEYIELSEYMPSKEWVILEHYAKKNVKFYDCCPEPYPDLTFYLRVRRRATFYSYTLILPCVLLSLITMVTFMLPPETPAKMLLGINVYIAFFTLLLLLRESTPPTSKRIPILGAYYCFNMTMTTTSTFLCAVLVDMHYRADKRNPPGRLLTFIIIEVIAQAMFFHIPPSIRAVIDAQKMERRQKQKKTVSLFRRLKGSIFQEGRQRTCTGKKQRTLVKFKQDLVAVTEELLGCVIVEAPKTATKHLHTNECLLYDEDEKAYRKKLSERSTKEVPPYSLARTISNNHEEHKALTTNSSDSLPQEIQKSLTQLPHKEQENCADSIVPVIDSNDNIVIQVPQLADSLLNKNKNNKTEPQNTNDGNSDFGCGSKALFCRENNRTFMLPTYSPIKRGVFVGATFERCRSPPLRSQPHCNYDERCNKSTMISKQASQEANTPVTKPYLNANRKRRPFLSTSFDLKHYNKFSMSDSTPSTSFDSVISAKIEPVIKKLEQQVETLGLLAAAKLSAQPSIATTSHCSKLSSCSCSKQTSFDRQSSMKSRRASAVEKERGEAVAVLISTDPEAIETELRLIHYMLSKFIEKVRNKEIGKQNAEAWRMISMVLDRLFLYGYIISMILSLTSLFPQRPPDLSNPPHYPNGTVVQDKYTAP